MKNSLLLIALVLMTTTIVSAQHASDYYPMQVGNYWIMRCDTLLGEYNPTIFREDVEDIDLILDEEYFRIKHSVINGFDWSSYFWMWIDSTGICIKAQGDTSAVDFAIIHDTPLLWMPNEMINVGFTWEWDSLMFGYTYTYSIESVSENVQVPAGEFNNCIVIRSIRTDTLENTMTQDAYYANDVGQILMIDSRLGRFELIEYFLQTDVDYEAEINIPAQFSLKQNYPNPFNPSTTIEYDLPKPANVRIEVYNIAGQKIQILLNKKISAGSHHVEFNTQNLSSGIYYYRIEAGEFQDVKKMILLK
jgi:hypothetical protein